MPRSDLPTARRARPTACTLLVGLVLALHGCATPPPAPVAIPQPTQIQGNIEASLMLNPSVSDRPSPMVVRIYELTTPAEFNNADFISLYEHDDAQLGSALVAKDELVLEPGQRRSYPKKLAPSTRFIGVFAAYRDLEHATWRSIVAIEPGKSQTLLIVAGARELSTRVVK